MNATSKKAFHVINRNGKFQGRLPFHPAVHQKFNKDNQFHALWETSNFLDLFLPCTYGELTGYTKDSKSAGNVIDWMEEKGRTGFRNQQCGDNKSQRVIYGDWDGNRGKAVVVPAESGIKSLKDLGLRLIMNSKSDTAKVRKYVRRILAHHEWAFPGEFSGSFEVEMGYGENFIMNNIESSVLYVDLKTLKGDNLALADGVCLVHIDFLNAIGVTAYKVGDAFKGTFLGAGLGKGFFHVVDNINYGIIVYGPKKQVSYTKVFFGSLGDVKGGEAYTDLQAMINFDTCDEGFALELAKKFLVEIMDAMHNEEKLRGLFLRLLPDAAEILNSETAEDEAERAEAWVLLEALRAGVPILKNPGLFRRVYRHLMTKVLDTTKGRIPYGNLARRFNVMPDLNVFGPDGSVDVTRSSIKDGHVVAMDSSIGWFFMHRQPSGHKLEGVCAVNVHDRRFRKFIGRDRVILGRGAARMLGIMGGGDMDDAVIGTSNDQLVRIMATGDYPVSMLPAFEAQPEVVNPYSKGVKYPRTWDMSDYFDAMAKARDISVGLGPIVNAGMLDTLLSGKHKENMLTYLADQIADSQNEETKQEYRAAFDWLRNRQDHQLKEVNSNQEALIDYLKMGKGDPAVLEPLIAKIADVRDKSLVLPQCWTVGGSQDTGRITEKRLAAQDFILAPSEICAVLEEINIQVALLQNALREEEWAMVDALPQILNQLFPYNKAYNLIAKDLKTFWVEEWTKVLSRHNVTEEESELERKRITDYIKSEFVQYNDAPEIQQAIAVEIARQTYRRRHTEPRLNQDGTVRSFPDGLLWNNYVGNIYVNALKEAGLAGLYVPVHMDRWSGSLRNEICEVEVLAGTVRRPADDFLVGFIATSDEVPNGTYTMSYGVICVQTPAVELLMSSNQVQEEQILNGNPTGKEEVVSFK